MKKSLSLLLSAICTISALAQTDIDAFRYSQRSIAGTARFISMGGAFGAIGGDLSAMSYNPAGLAIYRGSEFSISPSIYTGNTNADYLGGNTVSGRTVFNFGNIGLVLTNKDNDQSQVGWVNYNFGISYNRVADYNNASAIEGYNSSSSLLDYFAEKSKGVSYENLDAYNEYLAYYTYLINPDSLNNYTSAAPGGNLLQQRSCTTRGSMGETNFTFSGNYQNKLYLGATLSFATLNYTEESYFDGFDELNILDSLRQFEYSQYVKTQGRGVNLKFGFIYRPTDYIRLGGAIHTPTWLNMSDSYSNYMAARFDGGYSDTKYSPDGAFDYNLTTPFRALASVAVLFGKAGLISVDYEYSDISDANFHAPGYGFSQVNADIRKKYQSTNSLRTGMEWRLSNVYFRGGYGFTTSPVQNKYAVSGFDFTQQHFSGGVGFRDKNYFLDLGYMYSISKEYFQPYTLENTAVAGSDQRVNGYNATVTLGVKF